MKNRARCRLSAGKLGRRDKRRETFLEYDQWNTAEYAMDTLFLSYFNPITER